MREGRKRRFKRRKEQEEWGVGVCPGDARLRLEKTRGTGYSPGRGLFHASAPADSCRQEFRSSFCQRAYARSSVTKTRGCAAAAGHGRGHGHGHGTRTAAESRCCTSVSTIHLFSVVRF